MNPSNRTGTLDSWGFFLATTTKGEPMPPEGNPADEVPITQAEFEAGELSQLTAGPWQLRDVTAGDGEPDDFYEIVDPDGKTIARVFTRRADAMAMRCSSEWWDALDHIAFGHGPNATADELRQIARDAMGKR